jgi:hypothetical protein
VLSNTKLDERVTVYDKLEGISDPAGVTYFKILPKYLHGGTEENT